MLTLTWNHYSDDNSYSYFIGGVFLAHADTKEEAQAEAIFIIRAYQNGAHWAREEFPQLAALVMGEPLRVAA